MKNVVIFGSYILLDCIFFNQISELIIVYNSKFVWRMSYLCEFISHAIVASLNRTSLKFQTTEKMLGIIIMNNFTSTLFVLFLRSSNNIFDKGL